MKKKLTDSKITIFAQKPLFIITVEVSTLVCIKTFEWLNVNQVFTLKKMVLHILKYITFLSLSKHLRSDDDVKILRVKTLRFLKTM